MTDTTTLGRFGRKPLYIAIASAVFTFSVGTTVQAADTKTNASAVAKPLVLAACNPCKRNPCNPCAAKNACNPCNPCAAKKACNPCNPCAAKKACNPCNPCAAKKACNPCNPCAAKKACNPCNPCAAKNACNPCNPCAAKRAGACNPCNPCGVAKGPVYKAKGVLVDTRCYGFNESNVGNTHDMGGSQVPGCATACANMGIPVALLVNGTSGGLLYTIAAPAPALAKYMGMQARMTGTQIVGGLMMPQSLEVKTESGWTKVNTQGMM